MCVHFTCYGCPAASMGVLTPIVEYNSPPMATSRFCSGRWSLIAIWNSR